MLIVQLYVERQKFVFRPIVFLGESNIITWSENLSIAYAAVARQNYCCKIARIFYFGPLPWEFMTISGKEKELT